MSIEAMKQARGALRELVAQVEGRFLSIKDDHFAMQNARAAVRRLEAAIAEAEKQEPVAITERMAFAFHNAITDGAIGTDDLMDIMRGLEAAFAHITTPPQRKPLTDEQIKGIYEDCDAPTGGQFTLAFARAIEAAHGIKGEA